MSLPTAPRTARHGGTPTPGAKCSHLDSRRVPLVSHSTRFPRKPLAVPDAEHPLERRCWPDETVANSVWCFWSACIYRGFFPPISPSLLLLVNFDLSLMSFCRLATSWDGNGLCNPLRFRVLLVDRFHNLLCFFMKYLPRKKQRC